MTDTPALPPPSRPAPTMPSLLLLVAWTLGVSALSGYVAYSRSIAAAEESATARPPLAIIDVSAYAMHWSVGDSDAERVKNGLAAANTLAATLAGQGYVVIDRKDVMAAPPDVTVARP